MSICTAMPARSWPKQAQGGDLLIFGSPGLTHAFLALDAIDEFWIYPQSRAAGAGCSLSRRCREDEAETGGQPVFDNGVVRLNYVKGP